jgi:hypothetical protein
VPAHPNSNTTARGHDFGTRSSAHGSYQLKTSQLRPVTW